MAPYFIGSTLLGAKLNPLKSHPSNGPPTCATLPNHDSSPHDSPSPTKTHYNRETTKHRIGTSVAGHREQLSLPVECLTECQRHPQRHIAPALRSDRMRTNLGIGLLFGNVRVDDQGPVLSRVQKANPMTPAACLLKTLGRCAASHNASSPSNKWDHPDPNPAPINDSQQCMRTLSTNKAGG